MPAVNLSPIFNGQQFFTTAGTPLIGGLITTYLAGTATPALTYTDSAGSITNSNPIVLDGAGLMPAELWLLNATAYKFVVTDSVGANARTYDNITAPLAATSTGTSFTATSNTVSFTAQLLAVGGFNGYQINNQAGSRVADFMYWGASSSPLYGMAAGWAGINTPAGVGFTIGTNDLVQMSFSPSTGLGSMTQGLLLPNVNNGSSVNALDWYEEGSFTPAVTFGGAAVGTTYGINNMGRFTRIGNRVLFNLRLQVSAKGSSAGSAQVTGLPYLADGSPGAAEHMCAVDYNGLTGLTGAPIAGALDATTKLFLAQSGAAAAALLTDTSFTAAFNLYISGQYKV